MRLNLVNVPSSPVFRAGALLFCAAVGAFAVATGRAVRILSAAVAGLLAAAFILLVAAEQVQDRVLFRRWAREKEEGIARVRGGMRECGFRGNREYDRTCRLCGSRLIDPDAPGRHVRGPDA